MLILSLSFVLKLTTGTFCAGALRSLVNRENILIAVMCIELLLLAVNFKLQTRLKCFVKELMPGNFVENVFLGATWWECDIFIKTTNKILC